MTLPILVTNEQAKAIQNAADFGTTLVQETGNLARYIGRIMGTAPDNAVGIVLGEPLRYIRAVIACKIDERIQKIHEARGVKEIIPVSPSLAIPLLKAAYDESRPELQQIWAELIAAAMDPARSNRVRRSFLETVKRFDPIDALVLKKLYQIPGNLSPNPVEFMAAQFNVSSREIQVTVQNLVELKCVAYTLGQLSTYFELTPYGGELVRACST